MFFHCFCSFLCAFYKLFVIHLTQSVDQFFADLQLVFSILLVVLVLIVAVNCLRELFTKESGSLPDEEPEWSELGRKNCGVEAPETK